MAGSEQDEGKKGKAGSLRPGIKVVLAVCVLALAGFLLHRALSRYDAEQIQAAIAAIPMARIAAAIGFAGASYLTLTGFDWCALRYAGHPLPWRKAALASFCGLSIGHNLGFAAVSSGAIRYRFYSRWGLGLEEVAQVILFCGMTVGLGLLTLGGGALLARSDLATEILGLPRPLVIGLGLACLALVATWVALAALVRKPLIIRKFTLRMPPVALALLQVGLGTLNFAFVAACLHQTLLAIGDVPYASAAAVYVLANAAALVSHVPGGLGVIESVVLLLLPAANAVGAVIAFRAAYFLLPLCIGLPLFGLSELLLRKVSPRSDAPDQAPRSGESAAPDRQGGGPASGASTADDSSGGRSLKSANRFHREPA